MSILAFAAVNLFLTSILGGGKSSGLNEVKANGDFAITQMERMIRNAGRMETNNEGLVCQSNMSSISILNPDSQITTFSLDSNRIASNSGYLTSSNLTVTSGPTFDCVRSNSSAPDIVTINFSLRKGNPAVDRQADIVEVDFTTAVQTRVY
jgi:Tfp pilus assembly protein PilW